MSRTQTLEILGGIVDELGSLEEVERGTPLRSNDWNIIVDAVTSLAKLVASREETLGDQLEEGFAPADHDHRGTVSLSWFEPTTRRILENANSGSAGHRTGQKKIENSLGELRKNLNDVQSDMKGIRLGLDELRDADFARARSIGRVANDIEHLRGLESGFDNLVERLSGLDDGISTVLTFRDELESNGSVVDLRTLQDRVGGLEELRESLLTADGEVVRVRELESAIARLEQDAIGRDAVDGLIVDRLGDSGLFENSGLIDGIVSQVETRIDPRVTTVEDGIENVRGDLADLDVRMSPIDDRFIAVDTKLAGQDARLDGLSTMSPRLDQAEGRLSATETRLAGVTSSLGRVDALDRSVAGFGTRLDGFDATVRLSAANSAALNGLTNRTTALEATTAGIDRLPDRIFALESQTSSLGRIDSRITVVERQASSFSEQMDLTVAEMVTLSKTNDRLEFLENRTSELADWRVGTDLRLEKINQNNSSNVAERLSVLEEGFADQGASIRLLDRQVQPIIRSGRVLVNPDVVISGPGGRIR